MCIDVHLTTVINLTLLTWFKVQSSNMTASYLQHSILYLLIIIISSYIFLHEALCYPQPINTAFLCLLYKSL